MLITITYDDTLPMSRLAWLFRNIHDMAFGLKNYLPPFAGKPVFSPGKAELHVPDVDQATVEPLLDAFSLALAKDGYELQITYTP